MYARDEALIATPIGIIRLRGDDRMLEAIWIEPEPRGPRGLCRGTADALRQATEQIEQWFAGERRDFTLSLAPSGSPRGEALRQGMIAIPFGETASYGQLARLLGSGPRAIGQACARNPFPIVVPCHRVLAAGGRLGNYSGGAGPSTKRWLLDHELKYSGKTML